MPNQSHQLDRHSWSRGTRASTARIEGADVGSAEAYRESYPTFGNRKVKLGGKRLMSLTPCDGTSTSLRLTSDSDVPRYMISKFAPAPVKTYRARFEETRSKLHNLK